MVAVFGVTINFAFLPHIPSNALIRDVVSIEPYKTITPKKYARFLNGLNFVVHTIKSFSIGEKKKITVGIIIHNLYTAPKFMFNKGANTRLRKMKKAKIAVSGKL